MSEPLERKGSPPLRIVGLKVVTAVAVIVLLFIFIVFVGILYAVTGSEWFARITMILIVLGYVGYIFWLMHPRLPLVTAEDTDPASVRVFQSVSRVCRQAGIPMPRIVIDPEKVPNAMTFGFSPKSAYILLTDGLLQRLESDEELDAVIAHEVSHIINRDCGVATALNLVTLVAQGFYFLAINLLSLGAASTGCVVEIASAFAGGGLIGLFIFFMIIIFFVGLLFYGAMFAGVSAVLLCLTLIAVGAFQRQRERLADDFATQLVGPSPMASMLLKLAETDNHERTMICQLIGMEPQSEATIPAGQVLQTLQSVSPSFTLSTRVIELFAAHPLTLRRIHRVLAQARRPGLLETMLSPLAAAIESAATWLTPEQRAAARAPSDREGRVLLAGCVVGVLTALAVAAVPPRRVSQVPSESSTAQLEMLPPLPEQPQLAVKEVPMPMWIACLAIGLPAGAAVGMGIAVVLQRNGPFLGADVIDAALTGGLAWFISAVGLSVTLLLPNDLALLQASWVVLIVAFLVSVCGYVSLAPAPVQALPASLGAAPPPPPPPPPVQAVASGPVPREPVRPPPVAPIPAPPPVVLPVTPEPQASPAPTPPPVEELPTFSMAEEEKTPPETQDQTDGEQISFDRDD
jgi:Zn-dependent protease with chaperone function